MPSTTPVRCWTAGAFLAAEPVVHNLILTLLHGRLAQPEAGRYWVARDGERVAGLAFQSPLDFPATITPMASDVVAAVVDAIVRSGVDLPGVNGEAATAARFAGQWTEARKAAARPVHGQRIYEAGPVIPPAGVAGHQREAGEPDIDVVVDMMLGFHSEAEGSLPRNVEEVVARRVAAGQFYLWDDGGPVSMAAHSATVAGVTRIQAVFTPPNHRQRGYAAANVAELTAHIMAGGVRCILYTDLGNPVSNSVYRRIGYRAVSECLRYDFA